MKRKDRNKIECYRASILFTNLTVEKEFPSQSLELSGKKTNRWSLMTVEIHRGRNMYP